MEIKINLKKYLEKTQTMQGEDPKNYNDYPETLDSTKELLKIKNMI